MKLFQSLKREVMSLVSFQKVVLHIFFVIIQKMNICINVDLGNIFNNNYFQLFIKQLVKFQMTQQIVNRRELYKNQKLQQINQIYYCQCGKNYLTFSALYLHARNKHDIKLTTKRTTSNCKIELATGKTIITYFIREKTQQNSQLQVIQDLQSSKSKQNLSSENGSRFKLWKTIEAYLNQENSPINSSNPIEREVIYKLKQYLQQIQKIDENQFPKKNQDIALYFNEFIIYYLIRSYAKGLIRKQIIQGAANTLMKFWQWLKQRQNVTLYLMHRSFPQSSYPFQN